MTRLAARLLCACTFVIAVLAGAPALAQLDSAALVGTVRDSSNAVIPGATVTATQTTTGVSVTALTNGQGEYAFPSLKIGSYAVAAELQGFRRAIHQNIELHVQ